MKNLVLLLTVFITASMAPPKLFPRPPVGNGEVAEYKTVVKGEERQTRGWSAQTAKRYQPAEWTQSVRVTGDEIVWTRSEKLEGGGRRVMKCVMRGKSRIKAISWTDTFYSPAGKQETKIEQNFTDPSLKYPADMIPMFILPFLLRGADLNDGLIHEARFWHNPMSFSRGTWRVLGKKTITVPAGKFECYEVEAHILIDEAGLIARTLQRMLPKLYYYIDVNPPHSMVRFQIQIPGREMICNELVKFTPGK